MNYKVFNLYNRMTLRDIGIHPPLSIDREILEKHPFYNGILTLQIVYPGAFDNRVDFNSGVVSISATSYWSEYFDGTVTSPTADFSGTPTSIEEGQSVTFTEASTQGTNPITSWTWTFQGGTPGTYSGQNPPAIVYNTAGMYDATLVVSDGTLSDTELKMDYITVTVPPPFLMIDPQSVTVSASSGNTSFNITSNESWTIETSDPNVTATPFSGSGNATINVSYPSINTMAGETYTVTVTSDSNIVETFTINQNGVNDYVTLTPDNATVSASAGSTTFTVNCPDDASWDVTGLSSWVSASPLSGIGSATVQLDYDENTDPNSGFDDISVSTNTAMDVFTLTQAGAGTLVANFSANPTWGSGSLTTQFTDESIPAADPINSWLWNFGDGQSSSEQNPEHTYFIPGVYTVSLTVSDGTQTDTETKTAYIHVYEVLVGSAGLDQGLEVGQSAELEGSYSGGSGNVQIMWEGVNNSIPISDPNILNPQVGPFPSVDVYYFALTVEDLLTGEIITDTMFVDVITGIEEVNITEINVYPNPTSGALFIDTGKSIERLSIVNMAGSEVLLLENIGEMTQVDLSSLPSGLYFVRMISDGVLITKKVVKR